VPRIVKGIFGPTTQPASVWLPLNDKCCIWSWNSHVDTISTF